MKKFPPDTSAASPSAKERAELERRVQEELETVEALIGDKKYALAMKKLKWIFANSKDRFLLVHASDSIRTLVRNYQPAHVAVRRWRSDKEKLIVSQRADRQVIDEWQNLNEILRERKRTFEVLVKLSEEADSEDFRRQVIDFIWKKLARQRRYSLLTDKLWGLGLSLLNHEMESTRDKLFPNAYGIQLSRWTRAWNKKFQLEYMRDEGCLTYEVALALGEKKAAAVFAKKILSVETSDAMLARLIKAAIRAKDYEEAVNVYKNALETFSKRRLQKSTKILKTMPKTKLAKFTF